MCVDVYYVHESLPSAIAVLSSPSVRALFIIHARAAQALLFL